jgi:S1-C subfamily serine protease
MLYIKSARNIVASLFTLLVLMCGFCCNAAENPIPNAIRTLKPSVVQIRATFDDPADATVTALQAAGYHIADKNAVHITSLGTGFVVFAQDHDIYALTAAHVINFRLPHTQQDLVFNKITLSVLVAMPEEVDGTTFRGSFTIDSAQMVSQDESHDVALLRYRGDPSLIDGKIVGMGSPAKLANEAPTEGEIALISGYPLDQATMITTSGIVSSSYEVPVSTLGALGMPTGGNYDGDVYVVDAIANPGDSGGPVYSVDTGSVFGICDATLTGPGGAYTSVIPIQYALSLIKGSINAWKP